MDPNLHVGDDRYGGGWHEPQYYDSNPRPALHQHMSGLSIHDEMAEARPRDTRPKPSSNFLYYRFNKRGEDWAEAARSPISAPEADIERRVKKAKNSGEGAVLDQMTKMHYLRRSQIESLLHEINQNDQAGTPWEVVYIKAKKMQRRNSSKPEVPQMDVILARARPSSSLTLSKVKSYGNGPSGEIVRVGSSMRPTNIYEPRYYDDGPRNSRRDSVLTPLVDPVANLPLFDQEGRPMDEQGTVEYANAGLPPTIPREKPIGAKVDRKPKKERSKSRERHDDDVFVVGGTHSEPFPPLVDDEARSQSLDEILDGKSAKGEKRRGRKSKSPHRKEYPPRSHSRKRERRARSQSRSKSRPRPEDIYIPNTHTQDYFQMAGSSDASDYSDMSRSSFREDENSSRTTTDTHEGFGGRGSLYHDMPQQEPVYKKHYRGPSTEARRPAYYGEQHVIIPNASRSRRYSRAYDRQEPLPEPRQILYHDAPRELVPAGRYDPPLSPRSPTYRYPPPILHNPHDDGDMLRKEQEIENYQRQRVKEEWLKQREKDVEERERRLSVLEGDQRRYRPREWGRDERLYRDPKTGSLFLSVA